MLFWIACAVLAVLLGFFIFKGNGEAIAVTALIGGVFGGLVFAMIIPLIDADTGDPTLRQTFEIDRGSVHQVFDVNTKEEIYNFSVHGHRESVSVAKDDVDGPIIKTNITSNTDRLRYYCQDSSSWSVPWRFTDGCFYDLEVSQG